LNLRAVSLENQSRAQAANAWLLAARQRGVDAVSLQETRNLVHPVSGRPSVEALLPGTGFVTVAEAGREPGAGVVKGGGAALLLSQGLAAAVVRPEWLDGWESTPALASAAVGVEVDGRPGTVVLVAVYMPTDTGPNGKRHKEERRRTFLALDRLCERVEAADSDAGPAWVLVLGDQNAETPAGERGQAREGIYAEDGVLDFKSQRPHGRRAARARRENVTGYLWLWGRHGGRMAPCGPVDRDGAQAATFRMGRVGTLGAALDWAWGRRRLTPGAWGSRCGTRRARTRRRARAARLSPRRRWRASRPRWVQITQP
jgi:hypothetical protein